jgi:hypothetical protein
MLFICDVNDMNEFSSFPCLVPAINPANFVYDCFSGDSTHDVMCTIYINYVKGAWAIRKGVGLPQYAKSRPPRK